MTVISYIIWRIISTMSMIIQMIAIGLCSSPYPVKNPVSLAGTVVASQFPSFWMKSYTEPGSIPLTSGLMNMSGPRPRPAAAWFHADDYRNK